MVEIIRSHRSPEHDIHLSPEMKRAQDSAADPARSVWVSANAGSGKTHVLAERVVQHLLAHADPARILCLTYTRAAAAEMKTRIFARLSAMTTASDDDLAKILKDCKIVPTPQRLAEARRLFAAALETPGGLKVQTIHAFCERILRRFPLEANIAGRFETMDDTASARLTQTVRRRLLARIDAMPGSTLARAFRAIVETAGQSGFDSLVEAAIADRHELAEAMAAVTDGDGTMAGLDRLFGFVPGEDDAAIAASVWPLAPFADPAFPALVDQATALPNVKRMAVFRAGSRSLLAETDPRRRADLLQDLLLKNSGEPYGAEWYVTDPAHAVFPHWREAFASAGEAVHAMAARRTLRRAVDATRYALLIADALIADYEAEKRRAGLLEFSEVIRRTRDLLSRADVSAWVQYKLDAGIDHVLLDEAQDTSPDQLAVIDLLTREFQAGAGARREQRTRFTVGDEKQSIYSFQGADVAAFQAQFEAFRARERQLHPDFEQIRLNFSFRTARDVLRVVDAVFSHDDTRRGVSADAVIHEPAKPNLTGAVELWPLIAKEPVQRSDDWLIPRQLTPGATARLAKAIAATIRAQVEAGLARPGEFLVLVRRRGPFNTALVKALRDAGVPVGGLDRMVLDDHIAVRDLVALARVSLQPADDLALAALLKSPVFGWDDDMLAAIAIGRHEAETLSTALARHAADNPAAAGAVAQLTAWRARARAVPPFEFFASVLGPDGVRARLLARLGGETADMLDEFLVEALAIEDDGPADLERFIDRVAVDRREVKRNPDAGGDEVRIMTVHAAKGLEAPHVFLVDDGGKPHNAQHRPRFSKVDVAPAGANAERRLPLLRLSAEKPAISLRMEADARLQLADEEEYRRLLYVAMTRAERTLTVCGLRGSQKAGMALWHDMVKAGFESLDVHEVAGHPAADILAGPVLRHGTMVQGDAKTASAAEAVRSSPSQRLVFGRLARDPMLPKPLTPSGAMAVIEGDPDERAGPLLVSPVFGEGRADPALAALRGTVIHALLQRLPEVAAAERQAVARAYLSHAGAGWTESQREQAATEALAVLADPALADLFDPAASRAEVAIAGTICLGGTERSVTGQIDRLAVTAGAVTILDWKTTRPAPRSLDEVAPAQIAQLALYRAILERIWSDRPVCAMLVFTAAPLVMPVPAAKLDAALDDLDQRLRKGAGLSSGFTDESPDSA